MDNRVSFFYFLPKRAHSPVIRGELLGAVATVPGMANRHGK